jgi:cobalt-zinc-cadmium resistance protein CzcA
VRQLAAHGLGFVDLVAALEANNLSTGAGVRRAQRRRLRRARGGAHRVGRRARHRRRRRARRHADPAHRRRRVAIGGEPRTGSASQNGEEVVMGTAMMLLGANSRTVSHAVDARLAEVQRTLPPDVVATPVLDRSQLVDAVIRTVATNLVEGAILVIAVLFALLGNLRAAFITALAIRCRCCSPPSAWCRPAPAAT